MKLRFIISLLALTLSFSQLSAQRKNKAYLDYIEKYSSLAVKHQKQYGIPASITLAQGLLESGAGRSELARMSNNHFGIKCHSDWKGKRVYYDDDKKDDCFRKYNKPEDSFEDHARFLKRARYASLFELKVTIPSSVSSITGNPFSECKKLTSITVADDNPSYMSKDGVLFEKNGETLLFCLQGKEGDYQIPDSVKSINSGAFFNCDKLTGITVPNSVTNIQEGTFFGCSNLTSIVIPNSVTSIGEAAFSRCRNLTQMIIPDSVVSMGTQVFSECTELKSVTLSKNMTAIPFDTFLSCKSLTSVTIPDGVTSISASAFNYCAALSSVTIPDSVTAIGWAAFSNCSALTDVYYDGTEEQWKQVKIDNSNDENKCLNNATIHFVQPEPQPQPPVESSGTIAIQSVRVQPGKAVTVRLDLSANKGISNMRLQLSYPAGFTLENIQKGDALSTLFFTPPGKLTANPVNFVWDGTDADTSEGCILELTFRVADTVSPGDYKIHMSYQKGDVLDNDLEDIDLTLQDGAVTVAQFTYGDVNDDGVINMKDLGALRKYFAGGYDADKFVMEAADVNGDGVVNMKDLGILRRYLAGGYDINLGK